MKVSSKLESQNPNSKKESQLVNLAFLNEFCESRPWRDIGRISWRWAFHSATRHSEYCQGSAQTGRSLHSTLLILALRQSSFESWTYKLNRISVPFSYISDSQLSQRNSRPRSILMLILWFTLICRMLMSCWSPSNKSNRVSLWSPSMVWLTFS